MASEAILVYCAIRRKSDIGLHLPDLGENVTVLRIDEVDVGVVRAVVKRASVAICDTSQFKERVLRADRGFVFGEAQTCSAGPYLVTGDPAASWFSCRDNRGFLERLDGRVFRTQIGIQRCNAYCICLVETRWYECSVATSATSAARIAPSIARISSAKAG